LTATIPTKKIIAKKSHFFLDTLFSDFYTFVNCNRSVADSMSHRKGRIENHGNEKGSQETGKEGSKEGSKEEVSNSNRQHSRGTLQAFPLVFVEQEISFRLREPVRDNKKYDAPPLDCRYMG
jgi:hypothetical protein